jgi:hypothetical protein
MRALPVGVVTSWRRSVLPPWGFLIPATERSEGARGAQKEGARGEGRGGGTTAKACEGRARRARGVVAGWAGPSPFGADGPGVDRVLMSAPSYAPPCSARSSRWRP